MGGSHEELLSFSGQLSASRENSGRLRATMNTLKDTTSNTDLARCLAAEDLRCGDFVAILEVVCEYPSFLWSFDPQVLSPSEPVCMRWRSPDGGNPLRVKAICLPYVLAKEPNGKHKSLDLRQCRLVRLSPGYAQMAWKKFRKKRKKKRARAR